MEVVRKKHYDLFVRRTGAGLVGLEIRPPYENIETAQGLARMIGARGEDPSSNQIKGCEVTRHDETGTALAVATQGLISTQTLGARVEEIMNPADSVEVAVHILETPAGRA